LFDCLQFIFFIIHCIIALNCLYCVRLSHSINDYLLTYLLIIVAIISLIVVVVVVLTPIGCYSADTIYNNITRCRHRGSTIIMELPINLGRALT